MFSPGRKKERQLIKKPISYLRAIVDAHLHQSGFLVVQNAVVGEPPVSVIVKLHAACQAIWILGWHQNSSTQEGVF